MDVERSRVWDVPERAVQRSHLTQSVDEVLLQKSTSVRIRQLTFTITNTKIKLTDLCGNVLLQNDCENTLCEMSVQKHF